MRGHAPPRAAHGAPAPRRGGFKAQFAPPSLDQGQTGPRRYSAAPGRTALVPSSYRAHRIGDLVRPALGNAVATRAKQAQVSAHAAMARYNAAKEQTRLWKARARARKRAMDAAESRPAYVAARSRYLAADGKAIHI